MIALDTTVLACAVGGDHPWRGPCERLVEAIRDGKVDATTTPEVIQEFVHVRSRRTGRAEAANLGRKYAALLAPLLVVEGGDLERGLALYEGHPTMGSFDAVLAAVALRVSADALVSGDGDFDEVPGLNHVSPGSPEFGALLP